ncbi:hypothetical protein BXZ70DRAFT_323958 [Cristinia sonorae]|uniref:BTB domain-containing protein n=1 Tax=Cristinia sonorae TaxID=1940300 RepID=A0A8K0UKU6_9AGAR|nr:hypothetical protein BXZ70DRAFT_323958 [Cristinia sonorae]
MDEDYGQRVRPTAAIRNILDTYPFSIGIFRELLQNSDDAGASEQVFLLDHRTHAADNILSPKLAEAQGPALLAYNNAIFRSDDWEALQNINESSKRTDTSKIGKYGIGFRSCYHITDTPQILSDKYLAVFDPHLAFTNYGGSKVDFTHSLKYSDHISAMNLDVLHPSHLSGDALRGTVIRLPLRQAGGKSEISSKTLTTSEIRDLLINFVRSELCIALLFLGKLKSITVKEVDDRGVRCIGTAELVRATAASCRDASLSQEIVSATITCGENAQPNTQRWRVIHASFDKQLCSNILSQRLSRDAGADLQREKLSPAVSLAFPVSPSTPEDMHGRLFTFLPLPLPTGFPCHIHSLFALTPSRQNLRNAGEKGIVPGARDELLVEWNKALFEVFIPRAWAAALETLATSPIADIWAAWPPPSQDTPGGDPAYWRHLVANVAQAVVDERREVWPIMGRTTFTKLNDVLVATQDDELYFSALTSADVPITLPLPYIIDTMISMNIAFTKLSPQAAHELLVQNPRIVELSSEMKRILRLFLLSTGKPALMAGIPIIPLITGAFVALKIRPSSLCVAEEFVLLEDQAIPIFQQASANLIALSQLPSTFMPSASDTLNVTALGCRQVVTYVSTLISNLRDSARAAWLYQFWVWLVTWSRRDEVDSQLAYLPIIPGDDSNFYTPSTILFNSDGVDAILKTALSRFGLRFLSPHFPPTASAYLKTRGVLRAVNDIGILLQHLQPRHLHGLSDTEAFCLAEHMTRCLRSSSMPLSVTHRRRLRDLPIFPALLESPALHFTPSLSTVQQGSQMVLFDAGDAIILKYDNAILLPAVPNVVFVARSFKTLDATTAVASADTSFRSASPESDIVAKAVSHFALQTKAFQSALLRRMVAHWSRLPSEQIRSLGATAFVQVQTGNPKAPRDVVDPEATIASIFDPSDSRLPRILDTDDASIIASLRSLSLLCTSLSDEIISERLRVINVSPNSGHRGASHLLRLLQTTQYDCSDICDALQLRWLPTNRGLRRPDQCRDQTSHSPRELFDQVLDLLTDVREVTSPTLRSALGWDMPVPLEIIQRQLNTVLRNRPQDLPRYITTILIELGRRVQELSPSLIQSFRDITADQAWVPASDTLVLTSRALLDEESIPPPGFFKVHSRLLSYDGTREVLSRMGCMERPSNDALLEELRHSQSLPSSPSLAKDAIRLLKAIDLTSLSDHDNDKLLVPDFEGELRPLDQLYFDDMGVRAYGVELPQDRRRSHQDLRITLAEKLGIQTLSSLGLRQEELDDEEMHEDLTTRIANVLRQYTPDQAPNEFLANAADAGAERFHIVLDRRQHSTRQLLSEKMAPLQTSPALIIHNDAIFSDNDFKGIRRVGLGGKQERPDAIGKFGLGALAMFHFTESPMIVSGSSVLFLDPSRKYLPADGRSARNAIRVPLARMRINHCGHLLPLHGLYGFDGQSDFYNGTLFRLPLRTSSQAQHSNLNKISVSPEDVLGLLTIYGQTAAHSLLNIGINSIACAVRDTTGLRELWFANASRTNGTEVEGEGVSTSQITLEHRPPGTRQISAEVWHTVMQSATVASLPGDFQSLLAKHTIRHLTVTLMGCVSKALSRDPPRGRLYSHLPLPIPTSLPFHVDAPFVLADDRRSIRFEESGEMNLESKYNHWLLSERIPQLCGAFLHSWPSATNKTMWPGVIPRSESDPISRLTITSFYRKYFMESPHAFCQTMSGDRLPPSRSIFLGPEPDLVKEVLTLLEPAKFVRPPPHVRSLLPEDVQSVNAVAIRDVLISNTERLRSLHSRRHPGFTTEHIDALLSRMMSDAADSVVGIDLIPLADGSFSCVDKTSAIILTGSWRSGEEPWKVFAAKHFLHPSIQKCREDLIKLQLNVHKFNAEHAVRLVKEIIPAADQAILSAEQQRWLSSFWRHFNRFEISLSMLSPTKDIRTLPIVRTSTGSTFVSLHRCARHDVLAVPTLPYLTRLLERLNVILIPSAPDACPLPLHGYIPLTCSFEDVLQYFEVTNVPHNLMNLVDKEDYADFAAFARRHLLSLRIAHHNTIGKGRKRRVETTYTVKHLQIARQLPIWRAQRGGLVETLFVPACHSPLHMLPRDLPMHVASPFLDLTNTYIGFDNDLHDVLGIQPISLSALYPQLSFPGIAGAKQLPALRDLLDSILRYGTEAFPLLRVPNTFGVMVYAHTLYSNSVTVFRSAFASKPQYFLHPDFRVMEDRLSRFGLKHIVTVDTFRDCARAVHEEVIDSGASEGATTVFAYYNDSLWRLHTNAFPNLDEFRFIARSRIRRDYLHGVEPEFLDYATELPDIISPGKVLRPSLEAVAWTQRGRPNVALSEQLLVAYPSLGVPSASEVVEHLRVLKMIADSDRFSFNIDLISDLTETYRWLNTHVEECSPYLLAYQDEQLFLNVDNPRISWHFAAANQLIVNGLDEPPRQRVRSFLLEFRNLLLAVGGREITDVVRPVLELSPAEEVLVQWRSTFNEFRLEQHLTDVVLQSSDGHTFPAHRLILSSESSYFKSQFSGRWAIEGTLPLDVTGIVLGYILDFIYTRKVPCQTDDKQDLFAHREELLEILQVAHRWPLPVLFKVVENQLIDTISLGTFEELEEVATSYGADVLLNACVEYRSQNASVLEIEGC